MFLAHPEAHRCRILRGVTRALKPTIKCDVQITRRSHLKSSPKEGTRKISFLWVMITNEWTNVRTSTLARGQAWESSEITFYASKQSEREGNEVRPEIWPLPSSDVEVFLFFRNTHFEYYQQKQSTSSFHKRCLHFMYYQNCSNFAGSLEIIDINLHIAPYREGISVF